jgi:hypothetical protein
MKFMYLLVRIRVQAGDVRLDPLDESRIQMKRGYINPLKWKAWKKVLVANKYLVIAILREERATRCWEASGHNLLWWRSYGYSQTEVAPRCTCDALPYAHIHKDPGPAPNVVLGQDEDVWTALTKIVCMSKRRKKQRVVSGVDARNKRNKRIKVIRRRHI